MCADVPLYSAGRRGRRRGGGVSCEPKSQCLGGLPSLVSCLAGRCRSHPSRSSRCGILTRPPVSCCRLHTTRLAASRLSSADVSLFDNSAHVYAAHVARRHLHREPTMSFTLPPQKKKMLCLRDHSHETVSMALFLGGGGWRASNSCRRGT